jgi:hypothetical protein
VVYFASFYQINGVISNSISINVRPPPENIAEGTISRANGWLHVALSIQDINDVFLTQTIYIWFTVIKA